MPFFCLLYSEKWLPHKESNLDKQIQNLLCYHYTMRQTKEAFGSPIPVLCERGMN